jgi:nitrite reductase/ring-hydroxylating ferredoxin subunit/DMSO/TMAO reductase YedYZ heme-binding membrane subunit
MTASYTWVQWNPHKKMYDLLVIALSVVFMVVYSVISTLMYSDQESISGMILAIRAFGVLAIVLLHVILCIGPLARLSRLFSPILYNRRHLGVMMFFAALIHAGLSLLFYGAFGVQSPIAGLFDGYHSYTSISGFPFEIMGLLALLILFALASTSHDFWLAFLSPRAWKSLHMLVYVAYGFVLLHVVFGALQSERNISLAILLVLGAISITVLHLITGFRESDRDRDAVVTSGEWVDIGSVDEFPMDKGRVICLKDSNHVSVFRHENGISAMSNVCAHQGGPLGEGQIVNGCVTCPWHGYQYHAENGQSPPPFTERIPTYELRVQGERVLLNPEAKEPGTPVTPANPGALSNTRSQEEEQ